MSKRIVSVLFPLFALFAFGTATPVLSQTGGGPVRDAAQARPRLPRRNRRRRGRPDLRRTFDFNEPNVIYIFDRAGHVDETISLPAGVLPLGLEFDRAGNLYVANFSGGTVLRYSPPFNSGSVPDRNFPVCGGPAAGWD